MDQPLPPLGKYLLGTAIALDTMHTGQVPDIDPLSSGVTPKHFVRGEWFVSMAVLTGIVWRPPVARLQDQGQIGG